MATGGPENGSSSTKRKGWLVEAQRSGLAMFESILYAVIGLLLVVAAALILIGSVEDITAAVEANNGPADIGVIVLDHILLTLIVTELAYTLRIVIQTHEIAAEPFLFVGLIAVVRRILIVTAKFEGATMPDKQFTNLLLEYGMLGFLALSLSLAIFLIRRKPGKP